jgi:hypothetical protein
MNLCIGCKHALWKKTATGRLHSSQDGRCAIPAPEIKMPAAYYWIGGAPKPYGGYINRKPQERLTECSFFEPKA